MVSKRLTPACPIRLSSPVSRPRPPGFCISAGRARRCSTGCIARGRGRQVPAADRGYGPRTLHPRSDRGDPDRAELAGAGLGRRPGQPGRPRRPPCRGRAPDAGRGHGLQVLCHAGRDRGRSREPRAPRGARRFSARPGATRTRPRTRRALCGARESPAGRARPSSSDQVQGDVRIRNDQLDDMVLLRSDGTPTYMLAVVVDDHDMGVTHVIRGDDHLNNAARQMLVYRRWAGTCRSGRISR